MKYSLVWGGKGLSRTSHGFHRPWRHHHGQRRLLGARRSGSHVGHGLRAADPRDRAEESAAALKG